MKKILFWVSFPITFPTLVLFGLTSWFLQVMADFTASIAHKISAWRDWCFFDPEKDNEIRARLRREIHQNGKEKK